MSPKRLQTPERLSTDDELTAMRNYRWSVLKAHKVSSSAHLHMQMIDNRHQLLFSIFPLTLHTHTHTQTRAHACFHMLMIDCGLQLMLASSLLLFIWPFTAALGHSPPYIKLFFKHILTTDVKKSKSNSNEKGAHGADKLEEGFSTVQPIHTVENPHNPNFDNIVFDIVFSFES